MPIRIVAITGDTIPLVIIIGTNKLYDNVVVTIFEIKLVSIIVKAIIINKILAGLTFTNKELIKGIIPYSVAATYLPRARVVPHNRIAGHATPLEQASLILRMPQAIKIIMPIRVGHIVPSAFNATKVVGQIPTISQQITTPINTIKATISCQVQFVLSKWRELKSNFLSIPLISNR